MLQDIQGPAEKRDLFYYITFKNKTDKAGAARINWLLKTQL
jgi:hypothetical protein